MSRIADWLSRLGSGRARTTRRHSGEVQGDLHVAPTSAADPSIRWVELWIPTDRRALSTGCLWVGVDADGILRAYAGQMGTPPDVSSRRPFFHFNGATVLRDW